MHSVICFMFKKKDYLGVSGSRDFFEIFDVLNLKEKEFLSNAYFFILFSCNCLVLSCELFSLLEKQINLNLEIYFFFEFLKNICWLIEPIKQVKLKDMKNFHIKVRNGKILAVEYSKFDKFYFYVYSFPGHFIIYESVGTLD